MEIQKLLISKFRNYLRVSTGFYGIRIIREQRVQNHAVKYAFRRRECSFHLVVYNTADCQLSIWIIQLITPTFLAECFVILINIWIKYCIHINMHQILKILVIAACHRIYCLVRISHRIQKGVQRSFYQFHKRILGRKLFRATQNSMFHDMWHSGTVRCRCAESDIKYFIFIIIGDQKHPRTALFMS